MVIYPVNVVILVSIFVSKGSRYVGCSSHFFLAISPVQVVVRLRFTVKLIPVTPTLKKKALGEEKSEQIAVMAYEFHL